MSMKIFCFGELMLRMSPELHGEWIKKNEASVYIGGAELNVAAALATWGVPVRYCTALPDHYLSHEITNALEARSIDTSAVMWQGNRIGIYYLPQGRDLKHASVIYDREHSSFSQLKPGMINWDFVLEGCHWLHFSAICPGLNEAVFEVCKEAVEAAVRKKLTISIDLNYRSKLWQYGKPAPSLMPALVQHCDIVMGNIWAAESLLNIPSPIKDSRGKSKAELNDAALQSIGKLQSHFPNVQTLAYTFRMPKNYFAVMLHQGEKIISSEFPLDQIVNQVGSGDCFMGGLIYGLTQHNNPSATLNFASAAAVGKMKERGDFTQNSIESIQQLITQNGNH